MRIEPLGNTFLCQFLDGTTSSGRFRDTYGTKQIEVVTLTNEIEQIGSRWAKVTHVGPKVKEFKVGQYVLIHDRMWTPAFQWEHELHWKSDETNVLAVSDEPVFRY